MPLPGDTADLGFIRRCRDLVQLYYGVRMVAAIIENEVQGGGGWSPLILQDPRRIRYEIIIRNADPANAAEVQIGTPPTFDLGTAQDYEVGIDQTLVIDRNFLTDLDAVTIALNFFCSNENVVISTRETFLTPPPVDEVS